MLRIDIINKKFGDLTVIKQAKPKDGRSRVFCRCDCGKELDVISHQLRKGQSVSCGCRKLRIGESSHTWRGYKGMPKTYFTAVKWGAKARNFEFNITIEDLWNQWEKQQGKCALTGDELTLPQKYNGSASLDRKDSNKGYTPDNIQWIKKEINAMKMAMPEDEFIALCKKIVDYNLTNQSK